MTRRKPTHKNFSYVIAAFVIASVPLSTASFAQIHKWVDANGRVHYSDTPPPQKAKTSTELTMRKYKQAPVSTPTTVTEESTNKKPGTNKPNAESERTKQLEAELKAQKDAQKKQRCETLSKSKDNLAMGGRIYEMKDGKRKYLSSSEIDAKRAKVNQAYKRDCR